MSAPLLPLVGTGFLLGWSVAWPPGPINAEIARRCLARGFWAGFSLLLGAVSGDALWAVLVALGVGVFFSGPTARLAMGVVSVFLLVLLAFMFVRGAWRALRAPAGAPPAPKNFDDRRAGYLLGATMALTSPWNVAFWLAAVGRPEFSRGGAAALPVVVAAVIAGALAWGLIWSGSVVLLHRRVGGGRFWTVGVTGATGALMLYFAITSARALLAG